jgi:hypothetical protein
MQKKIIIISGAVIVLLAAVIGAWLYFARGEAPAQQQDEVADLFNTTASDTVAPTPTPTELPELPEVVAKVNGAELKKADLESTEARILAGQGIDITALSLEQRQQLRIQALDAIVSNSLLKEAAASTSTLVNEADIDAQIETIKGQFEDPSQFTQALAQQGVTEAEFRSNVASDLAIQKYLENTLNLLAVDVTEEELASLYEQQVASATQEMPPLAEAHDDFKAFVIQQKQQELVVNHIKELSNNANIEILI